MAFPARRAPRPSRDPRARRLGAGVLVTAAALAAAVAGAAPAHATWSVVGTDPATGQVGAAVASCTDVRDLTTTMALVPGAGAAVSIGPTTDTTPLLLATALRSGDTPAGVTASMSASRSTGGTQVGVAVIGKGTRTAADGVTAATSRASAGGTATALGNAVASPTVVAATGRAFDATPGPLAERLIAALRAGSVAGGDQGCGSQARAAAVVVLGTNSSLFVPAATPGPDTDASDLVASGLTPTQVAEALAARSVRPTPKGAHAPAVHASVVVPAGADALDAVEARYAALTTAASRAVPPGEVIDPAYAQGLTIATLILFGVVGLSVAVLIIIGLRRADGNAVPAEVDGPTRPKPFRGEVVSLFDLDLAAALRRSRENERRRQLQRDRSRPEGRDRAWSGSNSW